MMKNCFGFYLLLFIIAINLNAQNHSRYKFRKISADKGLSQSVITGIVQDHKGFMWFTTQDGLNRFDGYKFTNFYHNPDDPYSLSNNFIQGIFRDNDNQLWILTSDGLNHFDYKKEKFIVFYNNPNDPSSISNNEITSMAQSHDANLWVGTYGGGFNYYDKKKNTFKRYKHINGNPNSLCNDKVMAIKEDRFGILWIGTQGGGLNSFNCKTGKFSEYKANPIDPSALQSNFIRCIYEDIFNNLWVGTNNGLSLYNRHTDNFETLVKDLNHPNNSINGNTVLSITADSYGNLWVGTQEEGLNKLDLRQVHDHLKDVAVEHFGMQENDYGLSIRTVQSVYEDKDKNLWIGTYSGGINFISCFPDKFEKYQHSINDKNTINYPKVWGLCEDINNELWIGTDGGGLDRLNTKSKTIKHYLHNNNPSSISDNAILCGFRDHLNTLWFGTYVGGLNRISPRSEKFISYKHISNDTSSLGANDVRIIYEDSQKNLWVGTNGGGLCKFIPRLNNFKVFNTENSGISNNDIRSLLEDNKGRIWIGHYGSGLDCFDPAKGTFINYSYHKNLKTCLRNNYVFAILQDRKGRIWVGTGGGGVNLFLPATNSFKAYTDKEGLANNFIHAMLLDNIENLWISTNKGISKFAPDSNKFENFDIYDGLQNGEFNDGSALLTHEGLICFGGIQGFNIFNPEKVRKCNFAPDVVLTGLQLFNTPVKPNFDDQYDNPLKESICESKSITLNYKQIVFTIDYVALNFTYPEKTIYSYKMEGLDNEWNEVGTHRSATYRNLKPGQYIFKVKASNHDGIWSDKIASLEINVLPPFWKTWWANCIYFIVVCLIGYVIFSYYQRETALKSKLQLEQINRQKEHQLNLEKLRFFTNISHEFRTPLTLILGPLEEIIEKERKTTSLGRRLMLIYKNANKLLELINMLLDFRKVETGNMEVKVAKGNIVKFVKEICLVFRELGKQKKIQIKVIALVNEIFLWFDREKLEIILNNLLSNAFKFTPEEGSVTVEVLEGQSELYSSDYEVVIIKVSDTGIGINEKYLTNIFDSYYSLEHDKNYKGTGIGLALTKSLVELHKGKISVRSAEGKGTCFTIEFLKGNNHFSSENIVSNFKNSEDPMHYQTKRKVLAESPIGIAKIDENPIDQYPDLKLMLIVEDNNDVRAYIKESFTGLFRILEASNGLKGFDIATQSVPDIIISDVMMPEMDGIEFCNKIKSTLVTCHIPVILLTARSSLTHKKEGYDIGADSYVTKPFSVDLLTARVNNLLKSRLRLKEYHTRFMLLNPSEITVQSLDEKFLKGLVEVVEKLMANTDFDVNKLAQELNFSRSVLYRKVKALTNLSLIEFIRTIRLNRAAQLLKTGKYRVSDVAFDVGFNDIKHFSQCFKEQFQLSPSELLKNERNSKNKINEST